MKLDSFSIALGKRLDCGSVWKGKRFDYWFAYPSVTGLTWNDDDSRMAAKERQELVSALYPVRLAYLRMSARYF